ncbi:MAG: DUF2723 domain-containing protein [Thermodesulfovibrionales bacterium]|nr:DUF2723 domain-containing protein [Thermodesulfovibrionales bacterium]
MFFIIFFIYLLYLCPSVYNGDSPLFYASAFALGPAHPPGYPLYVLLGKLITFIPMGSIAYKINLFSALCGAAASLLVFKSVHMLTKDTATAIFSALLSAFLPLAWTESVKAEVYTLNSALTMLIFYLCLRGLQPPSSSEAGTFKSPGINTVFLSSLFLGIGMGNHHTIGFMLFPLIFACIAGPGEKRGRNVLLCLFLISIGMSVHIFSHIRSLKYFPEGLLFTYSDSGSLEKLFVTFFRKEYGSSLPSIASPAGEPIRFYRGALNTARYLIFSNMGLFSLLPAFSIPYLWRRKPLLAYSLISLLSYGAVLSAMVFAFGSPTDESNYFNSPYMLPVLYLVSVNAGWGLWYLIKPLKERFASSAKPLAIGIVLLPFVFALPHNLKDNDLSNFYLAEDFSNNLLESLPVVSVVITGPDAAYFPVFYKSLIERKRDDAPVLMGDKGGIISQVNPVWKYRILFPELAQGKLFTGKDEIYAEQGRLFAFDFIGLSDKLKKYFTPTPYIHGYRLFPKESMMDEKQHKKDIETAFGMFVYERALDEKAADPFSIDLKMSYFITITHYAYLQREEGNTALSQKLYEDATKLITPSGLAYYMNYLKLTKNKKEIESFIESIEPHAQKYPEVRLLQKQLQKEFL